MTGIRVLLVEDDELNQALIPAVLARSEDPLLRGAQVVAAGSLAEARAVLAGGGVDVVLLDAGLPDGSGLSLARELRDLGGEQPVVIAVTGAPQQHRAEAEVAGCVAVLGKPYRAAELRELIGGALLSAGHPRAG
jgi:two-component system, OmpR family, response regulator